MERKRLEWLSRRFGGLTVGQKLAAGTLIALMAATGLWVASRPVNTGAMEAILDQPFNEADLGPVTERLHARSIKYEVRDGKVYVPAAQKLDALSDLYYTSILTGEARGGFESVTKQMNIWDPPSKTEKMFNHERETRVERVISRFKGVRKATVVIDPTTERHIGQPVRASAMVDIQTHGEANPRQLATGAVNVLTGAVASLTRQRVKVTIDGASYNTGGEELAGDDLLARKQQCEQMYVSKVRQLLEFIPEVVVSVSVDLNVRSVEEERRFIDGDAEKPAQVAEMDADAVAANSVPPARGEKSPARQMVQKSRTPAGKETVKSASVAVPRSYFVGIYRRGNSKDLEPTDPLLQPVIESHAGRIRALVRNSLGLESEADVTVEAYEDSPPASATAAPVAATVDTNAAPTPAAAINNRLHEIVLVGGGVLGMLLLSVLLRRAKAVPEMVPQAASQRVDLVAGTIEDDRDDADAHQMFRRVRDVAGEHPDQAARVLREWIHQGR